MKGFKRFALGTLASAATATVGAVLFRLVWNSLFTNTIPANGIALSVCTACGALVGVFIYNSEERWNKSDYLIGGAILCGGAWLVGIAGSTITAEPELTFRAALVSIASLSAIGAAIGGVYRAVVGKFIEYPF